MSDEADIHAAKRPGKTYFSPRIATSRGALRIASEVIDSEGLKYATEKDEVVLRRTATGRTEIVAKFLEDDRRLQVVTIQAFNGACGGPQRTYFSFVGAEIPRLIDFFQRIATTNLDSPWAFRINQQISSQPALSRQQAASLVQEQPELFAEVMRAELTREDVVAMGYRKAQVAEFGRLLGDREHFDRAKEAHATGSDEALWQAFFERNPWIFGHGLSYLFVTGFDGRKLEQVVQGYDLLNPGKRADGLMKTRGIVSALCFVEIKTHETPLLDKIAYRRGCWAPSRELAGAVSQVQGTVAAAMRNLHGQLQLKDEQGAPTGEQVFNYRPRAFIVVGSLAQFVTTHGVNEEQLRSFELYRNSINDIEILTFDEIHERSRFLTSSRC